MKCYLIKLPTVARYVLSLESSHERHLTQFEKPVPPDEYVFRLGQSEGKYFMISQIILECAFAANLFSSVNLDLEGGGEKAAMKLRAEHIYVFS